MSRNNAFAKAAKAVLNAYRPEVPDINNSNNHGVPPSQSNLDYNEIIEIENKLQPLHDEYLRRGKLDLELIQRILDPREGFTQLKKLKDEYIRKYAPAGVYNYGAKPLKGLKKSRKSRKNRKSLKSRKNRKSRSN